VSRLRVAKGPAIIGRNPGARSAVAGIAGPAVDPRPEIAKQQRVPVLPERDEELAARAGRGREIGVKFQIGLPLVRLVGRSRSGRNGQQRDGQREDKSTDGGPPSLSPAVAAGSPSGCGPVNVRSQGLDCVATWQGDLAAGGERADIDQSRRANAGAANEGPEE